MSTATAPSPVHRPRVGDLLRGWRRRRRLSQLDLSIAAEVSTRHLSFVETGRSTPSRELVAHLAVVLDVPLRERNDLLVAAGYAPTYGETPLEVDEMGPVRAALDAVVAGHDPFPALVVDRRWDLVTANRSALALLADGVDPALLAPVPNVLRVSLHPNGLAPRIANLDEWAAHLLERLDRQVAASGDPALVALAAELRDLFGAERGDAGRDLGVDVAGRLFVPLVLRGPDGTELRLLSTVTTFGTALDLTVAELSIESFFPADDATAAALRALTAEP